MIYRHNIDPQARDTYVFCDIQDSSIADKVIGICPVRSKLVKVMEVHGTAAGQTCTGAIERLQGTETSGAGDQVATGINFQGTANTVQTATIVTSGNEIFEAGNRVGFNGTGNSASLATMIIVCQFRPVDS